jgi:hypothetical protein
MGSTALAGWFGVRAERLDELVALHQRATGSSPGRRYGTSEFNRTLVTALVAQFQAFVRDLHNLAMNEFVRTIEPPSRRDIIHSTLERGRRLDAQTPRRDHLGADFGRLGIELIPAVKDRDPRASRRLDTLDALIDLRNAISHGNDTEILRLAARGVVPTFGSFRRQRSTLNGLARTLDGVLAAQLADLLGTDPPW